jgi:LPXTG-motif cell wall-anchored protein
MNCEFKVSFLLSLLLLLLPIASADLIMPGFKTIHIENKITNIGQYADYDFISTGRIGETFNFDMCPVKVIGEDGVIPNYYKFCEVSVYAVEKGRFDANYLNSQLISQMGEEYSVPGVDWQDGISAKFEEHLSSIGAVEVLKGLSTSRSVPELDPATKISNNFTISLDSAKTLPDSSQTETSSLIYVYVGIAVVALLLIALYVVKRKKK